MVKMIPLNDPVCVSCLHLNNDSTSDFIGTPCDKQSNRMDNLQRYQKSESLHQSDSGEFVPEVDKEIRSVADKDDFRKLLISDKGTPEIFLSYLNSHCS